LQGEAAWYEEFGGSGACHDHISGGLAITVPSPGYNPFTKGGNGRIVCHTASLIEVSRTLAFLNGGNLQDGFIELLL
jgi:hypothetical protein